MELSVIERILLLQVLPVEGSYLNLKLLRETKEELSFTEEENKLLGFTQKEQQLTWKEGVVMDREYSFGEVVSDLIVSGLKDLDKQEKLTENHMVLWERFMEVENGNE